VGKVMIISTAIHLRRVSFTLNKVFHDVPVEFLYCAVPPRLDCLGRDRWSRPYDRGYVFKEMMKLAVLRGDLAHAWLGDSPSYEAPKVTAAAFPAVI
jgi:hypothetical protein